MARRSKTYVELAGQDDLRRAMAQLRFSALRNAVAVVRDSAEDIEREAKARVAVASGETRDSIKTIYRDGGLAATIGTGYFLGRFIEQGTRKMPARPFLNPAFQMVRPKFLQRLDAALNAAGREAEV